MKLYLFLVIALCVSNPVRANPSDGKPTPGHFHVDRMSYSSVPSTAELIRRNGEGHVEDIFDETWTKHRSCVDASEVPGPREFWVANPPKGVFGTVDYAPGIEEYKRQGVQNAERIIAWAIKQVDQWAPNGYRPATEKELYLFQMGFPESTKPGPMVALGSTATCRRGSTIGRARHEGMRCAAALDFYDGAILGSRFLDDVQWHYGDHYLLVAR